MNKSIVYKFRDLSLDEHKRWLNIPELYYASPLSFNDPFDSAINLRYDKLEEGEKLQLYRKGIRAENSKLNKREILKKAKEWLRKGLLNKENHLKANEDIFLNYTSKSIGILSLTKRKDHILLWSHYANYHKGFCVGYDQSGLEKYLENKYTTPGLVPFWFDVSYSDEYPIIIPKNNIPDQTLFEKQYGVKSNIWKYENEYRIVMLGGTNIQEQIPKDLILELTLGCKINVNDRKWIMDIMREKKINVPVYETTKHHEKFELIFKEI